MQKLFLFTTCCLAFICSEVTTNAQITVGALGQARLLTEPSGARDDNNGGNTATGSLIGTNAGNVDNFMIFDFSDLSAAAGQTVTGATLNFGVATGFSAGNHGSDQDIINVSEVEIGNLGWLRGSGVINGNDNNPTDGSVSFLNRVQHTGGSGTTEAWVDASGDVANLLGALTTLDSQAGYNVGAAPATLSFSVDAATAQGWVDNGLAGLVLSVTDNGDGNGRFNFIGNGATSGGSIVFQVVPEPGSAALLAGFGVLGFIRRKRA